MHPNPVFHTADNEQNLAYAGERAFGVLAVSGSDGLPMLAHVPFLVSDDRQSVDLHLVRSNPIARALHKPQPAKIAVSGPDSYVSPDWYDLDDQVPTWNYLAVHLTGQLELRPEEDLRALLDRQSALFETQLAPKTPWTTAKMNAGALNRMMRMIVPCRMRITEVDGTWKFSQNKPDAVRLNAADHVEGNALGVETKVVANLMRASGAPDAS